MLVVVSVAGGLFAWSEARAAPAQCSTAPADRWLIVPNECMGPAPWTGAEADFIRVFGARNVKRADVADSINSEGNTAAGIVLFPTDSLNSVNIAWDDPMHRRGVGFCYLQYLRSTRPAKFSLWRLASGIRLGMDVHVLELMNRGVFDIQLTNFDARQGVSSWKGGHLAAEKGFIGLSADEGDRHVDYSFSESIIVPSSDATVRAANLWIDYIAPGGMALHGR